MKAVAVSGLLVRAGRREIITDLSCAAEQGDFLAVIGPNGAGKTTLLKVMAGLISPVSGELRILGRPLAAYSRRQLAATVALVTQQLNPDFPFTVEETVLMGRAPHLGLLERERRHDFDIARQAMAFTQVDHLAARRLDQLSGGERQRVMIARAICQQPRIMLLDEPTAALDPAHQLAIMQLLRRLLAAEGMTVIMVSHDLNLAAMFAGRVLLIKEGRGLAIGPPEEILTPDYLRQAYGCSMYVDRHPLGGTVRVSLVAGNDHSLCKTVLTPVD
ncbi:Vitamin B12 ABC transporter, ATPase component BtuD [hydrothermal vent metagenome]|uniref:Vitamin B12 ABC transporter, ATPase component BtuD n=1 Tax=hydrothermal vent metagenome TaxID=652676 RepID=A0A3B0V814_9ZZZZ